MFQEILQGGSGGGGDALVTEEKNLFYEWVFTANTPSTKTYTFTEIFGKPNSQLKLNNVFFITSNVWINSSTHVLPSCIVQGENIIISVRTSDSVKADLYGYFVGI